MWESFLFAWLVLDGCLSLVLLLSFFFIDRYVLRKVGFGAVPRGICLVQLVFYGTWKLAEAMLFRVLYLRSVWISATIVSLVDPFASNILEDIVALSVTFVLAPGFYVWAMYLYVDHRIRR